MIEIQRADLSTPEHAAAVTRLLDAYASDEMGGGSGLSDFTKEHLASTLHKRPQTYVFLAYEDEAAVGLSICFESFSTFECRPILNIHDVFVAAEFRGREIAQGMLAAIESLAGELDCCKLSLEVLEGNRRAESLYRRFGFAGYELDPALGRALFYEKKLS
ncbi:GNAT family N-acetyltransferase [Coraliomargarita sinensis]|uniref:GNAT family N-acetyltransferase n=1 Tax=Coraliomargarita sinensis TaxID=2174842 RepID=A0A317ZLG8_9BACT|nr:GNAT family N-acetyltransferase [Coraliomargarita sinensis]PXA04788.1 GNAT family N-acetyltransferase [Coraliomargarita sinensis]